MEYLGKATKQLVEDNLPVFYKYRYTFSDDWKDDLKSQILRVKRIAEHIKSHWMYGDKMTVGLEHFTKGMLVTKPHVHIHFMSKHSSDTIRKGLAYSFELIGRCQSCKAEVLVDELKYWRYPLKQQSGETKRFCQVFGFSNEKEMIDVAYACWKQSAEVYVAKAEKKLERTSKDRLFVYLDTQQLSLEHDIVMAAYKYYVEYEDNFCVKTVNGYVHIYLLQKGILSYSDFKDRFYI